MIYVKDIIDKCNGVLICGDINIPLINFSKDTRTINEGDIYLGIKGTNFDGNLFLNDAFKKGAVVAIIDNDKEVNYKYKDKTIVKVDDTVKCIQTLAKYKRSLYNIPVVAVTGSVGKTSTKDMIAGVLESKYKVLKTSGNNNNHIGLPLTILKLKEEDVMVLEMGMNNRHEIELLTDIARPTIGVITNIGTAHIGNLGSRENIMEAKLEIVKGLTGPLIINNDNDIMHDNLNYIKSLNEVITFGIDNNSDYTAKIEKENIFTLDNCFLTSPINNKAFIYNSIVSYIVGRLLLIDKDKIASSLLNIKMSSNRLEYKEYQENIMLIDDTYNASYDSVISSLEILLKEKSNRKILVLGDILELGNFSESIHTKLGEYLLNSNLDYIILIGTDVKYTYNYLINNNYNNLKHFNKESDSYDFIKSLLRKGDTVLFKASNGMKLKNIVNKLLSI